MDHSDADCLVMVVLTHGEVNLLHAKDTRYEPEKLWKSFTADECTTLAGKPKLFFIQVTKNLGFIFKIL
jgi:caspase 7